MVELEVTVVEKKTLVSKNNKLEKNIMNIINLCSQDFIISHKSKL